MSNKLVQSLKNYEDHVINSAYHQVKQTQTKTLPFSFESNKAKFYASAIQTNLKLIENHLWELNVNSNDRNKVLQLLNLFENLKKEHSKESLKERLLILNKMKQIAKSLNIQARSNMKIKIPHLPLEIKDEIVADLQEMKHCFNAGCYRSAVILCGRILEIVLHRKYYDTTGFDVLEKNPGIGLGTLIAKLSDKNVKLDPGLNQQIHMINQARIFSVHKKQRAFYPSKTQAHAMILYTLDVLEKMF